MRPALGERSPIGGGRTEAAKDAFLYLLAFITLGVWTIQLGTLLFTLIDLKFPNPALSRADLALSRSLADELASVIVAFPLFLLVTRGIVRDARRQPERLESSVRKWLTYLALVVTASILIGDVVTFLAYFLRGDLDTRFVLKVLTLLVIAAGVFGYYLDSLRRETVSESRNRMFAAAALTAVLFGLAAGFFEIGSPARQRASSEDQRRLFDLSWIAHSLHGYWLRTSPGGHLVLPRTIQELRQAVIIGRPDVRIFDPVTGDAYEYLPGTGTAYQLCATFSQPSASDTGVSVRWSHPAGRACFALDASQEVDLVQRNF